MRNAKILPWLVSLGLLSACAIKQRVSAVSLADAAEGERICLIDSPLTRNDFGEALAMELADRGLEVVRIGVGASERNCPLTATYVGEWGVDVFTYLSYAEITVHRDESMVGRAIYDGRDGFWNLGKFVQADQKIPELVSRLFPTGSVARE